MNEQPTPTPLTARLRRAALGVARALLFGLSKLTRLVYVVLTTLVVVGWLLFTTSGAQWLADRAMDEEPRLALEVRGGSLWNGLEVAGVRWRDSGIDVFLDAAELRWNPLCLLQLRVCLGLLHGDGVRVAVDTAALATRDEDDTSEELDLPVTALFPDVRLQNVELRVDGHRVAWHQLALSGTLGRHSLRLESVDLRQLAVELAEDEGTDAPREAPPAEPITGIAALLDPANRQALSLPEIRLPLDIHLQDFSLTDAAITTGGETHRIASLRLSAEMVDRDLTVRRLAFEHTRMTASLNGSARLTGDYPVDLELDAEIRDAVDGETLRVNAALWNSIADLELRVRADGPGRLSLDGSARPLQPELPVDVALEWSSLGWPLRDPTLVRSDGGEALVRGDLRDYRVEASLDIAGADIPAGHWELAGSGDFRGLVLERLEGRLLDGRVLLAGDLGWADGLRWDLGLEAENISASELVPEAPDAIDARLTAAGSLVGGALTLDADIQRLQAVLQGQPLTAGGQVSHRPGTGWRIAGLRVNAGDSRLELAGIVGERMDVSGSIDLRNPGLFLPQLEGAVAGTFSVRGALERPDVELVLEGSDLAWNDQIRLATVALEASVIALAEGDSRLRLNVGGLELPESETGVERIELAADGSRRSHRLRLDIQGAPAELALVVSGGLDQRMAWDGTIERADIEGAGIGWTLENPLSARWNPDARQAVLAAHCWTHQTARLCAPEQLVLGAAGQAGVTLEGYELEWLEPWLPQGIGLLGMVRADVTASWGDGLPQVEGRLGVDRGSVILATEDMPADGSQAVQLDYDSMALALTLDREQLIARFDLVSDELGRADVDARVDVGADGGLGALTGELQLDALRIGVIRPFFPEIRTLEGEISASGTLAGDMRDPRFDGSVILADGTLETLALPVSLRGIRLELAVQGNEATLDGGFRSGPGEAEISGEATWSGDDWDAVVHLTGDRLNFAYDSIATLQASPDLQLRLRNRDVALSGSITIPRANIKLRQLPEGAVRESPDTVIVDEQPEPGEEKEPVAVPPTPGWSLSSDLEVVLGDRVELEGYGVTGRLAGQLGLRQRDDAPLLANGEIRIEEGRYRAYGQRLEIRQGRFLFSGPVDQPEIYIEAVRLVPNYDVVAGLRVEGRPADPRVSLFSEPSLPEEDVLAYLILGRPISEQGPESSDMMARAALALGIAGGGGLATAIAEDLGIEEFQLETAGEGEETQFVVSGYLRPNLYLSYGVGVFLPVNELTVRYSLTDNLYLEAVSSLENALDLFYTFEF